MAQILLPVYDDFSGVEFLGKVYFLSSSPLPIRYKRQSIISVIFLGNWVWGIALLIVLVQYNISRTSYPSPLDKKMRVR